MRESLNAEFRLSPFDRRHNERRRASPLLGTIWASSIRRFDRLAQHGPCRMSEWVPRRAETWHIGADDGGPADRHRHAIVPRTRPFAAALA